MNDEIFWLRSAPVRYRRNKEEEKLYNQQYPPPLITHYPEARVKFQAQVDAGNYVMGGGSQNYIHLLVTGDHWHKNSYDHSKEFKKCIVIFDYDKNGGLLGLEVITSTEDTELGDLKE